MYEGMKSSESEDQDLELDPVPLCGANVRKPGSQQRFGPFADVLEILCSGGGAVS